jgi:hypothetical protein
MLPSHAPTSRHVPFASDTIAVEALNQRARSSKACARCVAERFHGGSDGCCRRQTAVHSPHMPARSIVVIAVPLNLDGHFIDERTPTSDIPHTDYALRNACNDRI